MPPLNIDEKQRIRDEEYFRAEIRKELGTIKAPPTLMQRCADFAWQQQFQPDFACRGTHR